MALSIVSCTSSPSLMQTYNLFELFVFITVRPAHFCAILSATSGSTNDLAAPSGPSSSTLSHWNKIGVLRKKKARRRRIAVSAVAQGHEKTDQRKMHNCGLLHAVS